jgi:hypothetical protein
MVTSIDPTRMDIMSSVPNKEVFPGVIAGVTPSASTGQGREYTPPCKPKHVLSHEYRRGMLRQYPHSFCVSVSITFHLTH